MTDSPTISPSGWWLYILDCDGRLYTGISTDPERRYCEHLAGGPKAAKFSRGSQQIEMKYTVRVGPHSLALKLEHAVKRLKRSDKLALLEERPDLHALTERLDV